MEKKQILDLYELYDCLFYKQVSSHTVHLIKMRKQQVEFVHFLCIPLDKNSEQCILVIFSLFYHTADSHETLPSETLPLNAAEKMTQGLIFIHHNIQHSHENHTFLYFRHYYGSLIKYVMWRSMW